MASRPEQLSEITLAPALQKSREARHMRRDGASGHSRPPVIPRRHQVPQQAFDLVVSIFGAMFAPKPFEVAKEMVRVTRPGGRIIMGNWIPNDPTLVAQILKISSAYTPPPPEGFVSPMTWGIESNVILRFGSAGVPAENISFARDTFTFNYPYSPAAFADEFRKYYGPTMNAFEAAEKNNQAADLQKELEELFKSREPKPSQRSHVHSCNLPPRHGCALKGFRWPPLPRTLSITLAGSESEACFRRRAGQPDRNPKPSASLPPAIQKPLLVTGYIPSGP